MSSCLPSLHVAFFFFFPQTRKEHNGLHVKRKTKKEGKGRERKKKMLHRIKTSKWWKDCANALFFQHSGYGTCRAYTVFLLPSAKRRQGKKEREKRKEVLNIVETTSDIRTQCNSSGNRYTQRWFFILYFLLNNPLNQRALQWGISERACSNGTTWRDILRYIHAINDRAFRTTYRKFAPARIWNSVFIFSEDFIRVLINPRRLERR